jgi:hypothetical protein
MSSAPLRDFANAIVRTPSPTRVARISAASAFALRRAPDSSSRIGGFQSANSFSPRGEASSGKASNSRPVSRAARSAGLPIVAEAVTNDGVDPYRAATRRRRRSTLATCDPKIPRSACISSTATTVSCLKNVAHRSCDGRIP